MASHSKKFIVHESLMTGFQRNTLTRLLSKKAIDTRMICYDGLEIKAKSSHMKFVEVYFESDDEDVSV